MTFNRISLCSTKEAWSPFFFFHGDDMFKEGGATNLQCPGDGEKKGGPDKDKVDIGLGVHRYGLCMVCIM